MPLALAGFEWRYHTRTLTFLAAATLLFLLGIFLQGRLGAAANVHVNAPYAIAYGLSMTSLLAVFVAMVFCADAALRDSACRMTELVYASPLRKRDFLLARFGGAFAASLAAMCMLAAGMLAATFLPLNESQLLGPRQPAHYLWVLAVMVGPNVLLVSALLFAIASFSRSMVATYAGAMLLYGLYWVGAALGGSPMMAQASPPTVEGMALAALLDPFGISAVLEQTMHWNAWDKNTEQIALSGKLLFNRIACLGLAALILLALYWRFQFKLPNASAGKKNPSPAQESAPAAPYRAATPPARRAQWQAFQSLLRLEIGVVVKGFPFIAMMLIWMIMVGIELANGLSNADGGSPSLPHTALLIGRFQFDMLPLFGNILVIFFSGELVWRERALRIDALLDPTPASALVFFAAKWVALVCLPMLMILAGIACSLAFQLALGFAAFEPGLYLSLFYFGGLPLALMATLALFFQVVTRHKYLGMLLTGVVAILSSGAGASIGLEHPMLYFSRAPALLYSEMNGYGATDIAFHWYMAYWGALSALLGWVALRRWRRGERGHVGQGNKAGVAAALACAAVLLGTGGAIYYQTNVTGEYTSSRASAAWKAGYEQHYRRYKDRPQPTLTVVRSKVDLYPAQRRLHIEGEYRLHNRSGVALNEVLVASGLEAKEIGMRLAGARVVERDERYGQTLYRLDRPLAPGQETTLSFTLEDRHTPFEQSQSRGVNENASLLFTLPLLPHIGYNERLELDAPSERAKQGLLPKPAQATVEAEIAAHQGDFSKRYDWVEFDTTISTDAGQTALGIGRLRRQWMADGRPHFHYRSERPVRNVGGILSGRYAVSRQMHKGVSVELYYHPAHALNVARMLKAAQASLDYFQRQFGPYPHDHLRIIEMPASTGNTGFAMPGTILIGERGGFFEDLRTERATDQVTRRIAHEVGHQWWGHLVDPAPIEGGLVMVETLAKYSEMRVIEQTYGKQALGRLVDFELGRYLRGSARDSAPESPLYRVMDQGYLMYSKGALAMHALSETMGVAATDAALRAIVQAHAYPRRPATSLDLVAALVQASPAHAALIEETFKQNVRYQLKADSAHYTRLEDGRYRLNVQVQARKSTLDASGRLVDQAFGQDFQIAVFENGKEGESGQIYRASHRLGAGKSEISLVLARKPGTVVIEPALRFIERDRNDNIVEAKEVTDIRVVE